MKQAHISRKTLLFISIFIISLQKPDDDFEEYLDEETESVDNFYEQPYEVEINEAAGDKDDSFLDDSAVSVEELKSLF